MKVQIYVATHKKARMPSDKIYIPIQSGSALYPDLGYQRDDSGDNISNKNSAYNNLCPLYWSWKNSAADIIGSVHYRRLFYGKKKSINDDWQNLLNANEIEEIAKKYDIILPKKSHYFFMSLRSHYINSYGGLKKIHSNDLSTLGDVIADMYPEYSDAFNKVMRRHWGHMGNLSIMTAKKFDEYCSFMFDVLFECEKRLQGKRHDYNRYIAAISEFIPDIWIEHNQYPYKELKLFMPEKPFFLTKVFNVLKRMLFGKREKNRFNANDFTEKNKKLGDN